MAERRRLIAGNWKMNNTVPEAVVLAQEISNIFERDYSHRIDVAVIPPFVDIKPVASVFEFDRVDVAVGAQNVYWQEAGAYTGEISVKMLKDIRCTYCIVGHSERRELFGETNEEVNLKVKALLGGGISPIVCVGESLSMRDGGSYLGYITAQVRAAFAGIDAPAARSCVVAYEPIWAIGTGRTATPEQAEEACAAIRAQLAELYDEETANAMRVLYGGSMNEGNADLLLAMPNIDGGLVGGASLKAKSFVEIVKAALR